MCLDDEELYNWYKQISVLEQQYYQSVLTLDIITQTGIHFLTKLKSFSGQMKL